MASNAGRTGLHLRDDSARHRSGYAASMDSWRRRVDPQLVDIGLVAVVVLASTLSLAGPASGAEASPLRWVLGVAVAVPLLARRHAPEAALIIIAALAVLQTLLLREMPGFGAFLALLVGGYAVGAHATLRNGLVAMALCLVAVTVVGAAVEPLSAEGVVIPFVYLGAAWGVGRLVGARSARADEMAATNERLVREQSEREQAILADERARISRELHDVVAHAVTTMVLQAGAAQAELGERNPAARVRLANIESSGRQALDELRRVLTVMRDPNRTGIQEPMPGIADLPALAEETRASGVQVDLSAEISRDLPPGLDLSVYRIVQEALTNVLRHASASRASVHIREQRDAVVIEVADDGRGAPRPGDAVGSGRGLIGMRERAALFGGTVEAGADVDHGGFRVSVRLPYRDVAP